MDLLDHLRRIQAPPLVAPPHYTDELYPVAEFDRTYDAWVEDNGRLGATYRYQGWQSGLDHDEADLSLDGHRVAALRAWVGPSPNQLGAPDAGHFVHRAVCEPCEWASPPVTDRELRVALWLDHAAPGWRDLPPVAPPPHATGRAKQHGAALEKWRMAAEATYPAGWARPGAPIVTARMAPGTRTVGRRSPWGGYDVSDRTQGLTYAPLPGAPTVHGPSNPAAPSSPNAGGEVGL